MKNFRRSCSIEVSTSLVCVSSAIKYVRAGVVRVALLGVFTVAATPTFAQTIIDPVYPARVAVLRFEPSNPTVGQLVVPIVEGVWPNGCVPQNGQVSGGALRRTVTLVLPSAASACTLALKPYKLELPSVKFDRDGEHEFQTVDESGKFYGLTLLTVFAVGSTIPQDALSGLWFEPITSGSGLFMTRSLAGTTDQTFGAWFYYNTAGLPSWVSFQEGVWQSPGVLVGNVYQTNADQKTCSPLDSACVSNWLPAPASKINKVGSFKMTVTSTYSAELVISSASSESRKIQLIKQMR